MGHNSLLHVEFRGPERSEEHRLQAAGMLAHPLVAASRSHAPPASQARPGSEGSDRFRQVQIGQPWPLEVQKGSERFRKTKQRNFFHNVEMCHLPAKTAKKKLIGSDRFR